MHIFVFLCICTYFYKSIYLIDLWFVELFYLRVGICKICLLSHPKNLMLWVYKKFCADFHQHLLVDWVYMKIFGGFYPTIVTGLGLYEILEVLHSKNLRIQMKFGPFYNNFLYTTKRWDVLARNLNIRPKHKILRTITGRNFIYAHGTKHTQKNKGAYQGAPSTNSLFNSLLYFFISNFSQ